MQQARPLALICTWHRCPSCSTHCLLPLPVRLTNVRVKNVSISRTPPRWKKPNSETSYAWLKITGSPLLFFNSSSVNRASAIDSIFTILLAKVAVCESLWLLSKCVGKIFRRVALSVAWFGRFVSNRGHWHRRSRKSVAPPIYHQRHHTTTPTSTKKKKLFRTIMHI